MELFQHVLKNGIRLVHYRTSNNVAYCGLMINAGSRDENVDRGEHGVAHFIEHMLFKGTSRRKSYRVLSYLDDAGGELNAYTTKEETAIYASVLKENIERAFDIISDIAFNSIFPEREMKKEKDVIVEEINSYLDNPSELIFDDFEDMVFNGHPLGRNILGTPESVKAASRESLMNFISKNYYTDQIVFSSVGNITDKKALYLFEKYFSNIPAKSGKLRPSPQCLPRQSNLIKEMDTYQSHCMIGNVAYSMRDEHRLGLIVLNNILGGQAMNSRLTLSLREKNGLAYDVESNYSPYYDTGIFSIYFGTETQNIDKGLSIAKRELAKLRDNTLGTIQLSKAKTQIKGYLARSYENYESLMLSLCKSFLSFGKIDSIEEINAKIDDLTSSELQEIANEIFNPDQLSTLIYK